MKSPPELWADLEGGRLAQELGDADVRTTEPERALAWEAAWARGTALIEPSGWGTKVTLTAEVEEPPAEPAAAAEPPPPPPPPSPLAAEVREGERQAARLGFWSRLFGRPEPQPQPQPEPARPAAPPPAPEPAPHAEARRQPESEDAEQRLTALLDSLGSAHRRPFAQNG